MYLVQPLLPPEGLAANLLRDGTDERFVQALRTVLDTAGKLLRANAHRSDGRVVTVDAQLSNWWFDMDSGAPPVLIDVGTPFMRRNGIDECGTEFFLAPVPALLRGHYRRQRAVQKYIDDYFSPRLLALDLLGNFHKEGRPDRIDPGMRVVNAWLSEVDDSRPIQRQEVDDYYRKDAADLELYLRIRRLDRWLHRHVLRRRYPFILPGAIRR